MTILTNAPDQKFPPEVYTTEARLPAVYETAKAALAECASIDECKGWSDKAAALASYAKQIDDSTLLKMATRIKARAVRRAGELLEQIAPQHGANQNIRDGGGPNVLTRRTAAQKAGMSRHQQKTATRLARIPGRDFETRIESRNPPTVTQLAAQGTTRRPVVRHGAQDSYIPELNVIEHHELSYGEITPELRRRMTEHFIRTMDYFEEYAVRYILPVRLPIRFEEDKLEPIRARMLGIIEWSEALLAEINDVLELKTEAKARDAGEGEALHDE